jgi:IMP cyclohydrolase
MQRICAEPCSEYFEKESQMTDLAKEISSTTYPGRGIVIGTSEDGKKAVCAYFIMGRSENSRNRIFVEEGEGIRTEAFDPSKMEDPSLIIYAPVRVRGTSTIVTNGDQTDTIYELMQAGQSFEESLRTREFEPDAPNYTPRISGIMNVKNGEYDFALSILKSNHGDPSSCQRFTFTYENPKAGEGYFIHTYMGDGSPLPSFEGEPTQVNISGDIDTFTKIVWEALNADNKVSLFTRYIDIETGAVESRIVNKNV